MILNISFLNTLFYCLSYFTMKASFRYSRTWEWKQHFCWNKRFNIIQVHWKVKLNPRSSETISKTAIWIWCKSRLPLLFPTNQFVSSFSIGTVHSYAISLRTATWSKHFSWQETDQNFLSHLSNVSHKDMA